MTSQARKKGIQRKRVIYSALNTKVFVGWSPAHGSLRGDGDCYTQVGLKRIELAVVVTIQTTACRIRGRQAVLLSPSGESWDWAPPAWLPVDGSAMGGTFNSPPTYLARCRLMQQESVGVTGQTPVPVDRWQVQNLSAAHRNPSQGSADGSRLNSSLRVEQPR